MLIIIALSFFIVLCVGENGQPLQGVVEHKRLQRNWNITTLRIHDIYEDPPNGRSVLNVTYIDPVYRPDGPDWRYTLYSFGDEDGKHTFYFKPSSGKCTYRVSPLQLLYTLASRCENPPSIREDDVTFGIGKDALTLSVYNYGSTVNTKRIYCAGTIPVLYRSEGQNSHAISVWRDMTRELDESAFLLPDSCLDALEEHKASTRSQESSQESSEEK